MKPFRCDTSTSHVPAAAAKVINTAAKALFCAPVTGLTLTVTLPLSHEPQGLLDVLCDGVAYLVDGDAIYIWYSPEGNFEHAGYYRLLRFEYIATPAFRRSLKKSVKFTLSTTKKL